MAIYRSREVAEFVNPLFIGPKEKVTIAATSATGTLNFDVSDQAVTYFTSAASGNWTLNLRGNSSTALTSLLSVGHSITVSFLVTQGATAYYQSATQVDGVAVTPKWLGGFAPTAGSASAIDVYSFTVVKTAATPTYLVLASVGKFS